MRTSAALFCLCFLPSAISDAAPAEVLADGQGNHSLPCRLEVVEVGTGWPVPLVQLRTTHNVSFVTDNAGLVAFDLPELMGREVWFEIEGQGYEVKPDGFGNRGVRLTPIPGKTLRIEVERKIIAKRLGRLTGAGIFAESQKLGLENSWHESGVLGCDSVQNAIHNGQLFWLWGDTTLARYPLGIFNSTGALSDIQPLNAFEPPLKLPLRLYIDNKGAPRGIANIPGDGPTWPSGVVSLPDRQGQSRLVATYAKITPPLDAYECGLTLWNEKTSTFEPLAVLWRKSTGQPKPAPMPDGHAAFWTSPGGEKFVLFGNPFPTLQCPATFEAWQDTNSWKAMVPQKELSAPDGSVVKPHSGSIAYNGFRKRWVTVFMESFGKPSAFGELWYAEANLPTGPWGKAVKVLSHQHYTFYNPRLHLEFVSENSSVLLFEGTYTLQFSDAKQATPRYDYNQILYRLDLDDPALAPAQRR